MSQTPLSRYGVVKDRGERQVKPGFDQDGRRRDCCHKGCESPDDMCFLIRCYPNGEAEPQCKTCEPCKSYVNQFIDFKTGAEIMHEQAGGH
ncbi:MAG TPA: hypothetical protein VGK23_02315 [Methanomassiliicoccales archaeon]